MLYYNNLNNLIKSQCNPPQITIFKTILNHRDYVTNWMVLQFKNGVKETTKINRLPSSIQTNNPLTEMQSERTYIHVYID